MLKMHGIQQANTLQWHAAPQGNDMIRVQESET